MPTEDTKLSALRKHMREQLAQGFDRVTVKPGTEGERSGGKLSKLHAMLGLPAEVPETDLGDD